MWWLLIVLVVLAALPFVLERKRWPMNGVARNAAPGQFAALSQGTTHYQWHGPARGPVAVCIHGLTTPSFVWDGVVQGLTVLGFRVLTYDLYGRGFSDRPAGKQNRRFFLTQLNDLLQTLQVEDEITLLGYSMGGSIATCFAAEQPHRIRRLVLLAPAGLALTPGGMAEFLRKTPLLGDWLMRVAGGWMMRQDRRRGSDLSDSLCERMDDETKTQGFLPAVLSSQRNMLAEVLTAEHRAIARLSLPVLGIWGERDVVIPLSALGKLSEINLEAHHVSVAGAGHALPMTHPRDVTEAIREFLRVT